MRVTEVDVDGSRMHLYDSSDGHAKVGDDAPHAHYALGRSDVHTEVSAFKTIAQRIGKVDKVLELFGGSGWHSSVIQKACDPEFHAAVDISEDCVRSITFSPALEAVWPIKADSYEWGASLPALEYEWIHADFNNATYMKWRNADSKVGKLVEKIFAGASRWVTLTDSATFGLARFTKNREAYQKLFQTEKPVSFTDYFQEVAKVVAERFGFQCRDAVVWHRMAGMFLLERSVDRSGFTVREHKEKIPVQMVSTQIIDTTPAPAKPEVAQ